MFINYQKHYFILWIYFPSYFIVLKKNKIKVIKK